MEVGDEVTFYYYLEFYEGIIQKVDVSTVHILTYKGVVQNVPKNEVVRKSNTTTIR